MDKEIIKQIEAINTGTDSLFGEGSGLLDDLVHESFNSMASDLNNEGTEAQVKHLIDSGAFLSPEGVLDALKTMVGE